METMEVDTCIVGAGFAGLSAGYKLKKNNKSILILEARDRVGGRVFTEILPDGTPVNRGGTWLGAGHDRMYNLVKELGIEIYRQYSTGDNLLILNQKLHRYETKIPINLLALADLGLAIYRFERMANQVPLEASWKAPKAKKWDSQTIGSWIDSPFNVLTTSARKILRAFFIGVFMADPAEVSLLNGLFLLHSLKSLEWITSTIGGAQQDLVVGGMQSVADKLALQLGTEAIRFNTPVQFVKQEKEKVIIKSNEFQVTARHLVMAIPPIMAGRIEYEPGLPLIKTQLMDRSPPGQGIKWNVVYTEPFWRDQNLTGQGANFDEAPQDCLDCTPLGGSPGVLSVFAFGPSARQIGCLTKEERQRIVLDGLVKRFGAYASKPIYIDEYDWSADPWSRGDMFAHYPPGVLTGFGSALRAPCNRIHWAGTETATQWSGSIEGAFRSGERAAEEILSANY